MADNTVISVENVSMTFNITKEKIDSLKEYFVKMVKHELMFKQFTALQDINFTIAKGEIVGLMGLNGSGKSTLLKIIAGVMKPSTGKVTVKGSVAPLIEVGAGFNPDLTGRENIFLNGYLLGFSKQYINEHMQEIIDFAELGEFIDVPLKNYSSGMKSRLGFSIATAVNPDVLIVDEVLSVGDFKFQQKCHKKIRELMSGETTVFIVSHNVGQIRELCTRCIWLEKGKIVAEGPSQEICDKYSQQ